MRLLVVSEGQTAVDGVGQLDEVFARISRN